MDTALDYYLKSKKIKEELQGKFSADVGMSCNNIGFAYIEKK